MPKAYPAEFRRDVIDVARKGEAPLAQIAKDFGISESCLHRWMQVADVEDGVRPGVTSGGVGRDAGAEEAEPLLEQENEILRRAAAYLARDITPK